MHRSVQIRNVLFWSRIVHAPSLAPNYGCSSGEGGGGSSADGRGYVFYVAVVSPPIIGMLTSLCISSFCGLPKPQCIAVAIETCYQNTGIALTVALTSFTGEQQVREVLCAQ